MQQIEKTCCFSGHRIIAQASIPLIMVKLDLAITDMIKRGVTDFITGGAIGFDMLAAKAMARRKDQGADIRLIMALPFPGHDVLWKDEQREELEILMAQADEVHYIAQRPNKQTAIKSCYYQRNKYMVDRAQYVVAACRKIQSGTAQTLNYAMRQKKTIIHIMKENF